MEIMSIEGLRCRFAAILVRLRAGCKREVRSKRRCATLFAAGERESAVERVVHRTCTLCEACCGIEVHLSGERIRTFRGDRRDPLSRGHVCAKVFGLRDLHEDPDRLRRPLRRRRNGSPGNGGGDAEPDWEAISWDEAFELAAAGILRVQRENGEGSAASYLGEPVVHNLGALLFSDELVAAVGSEQRFSANTLDQIPRQLVCHWMYGSGLFVSVPDIDRTQHMLILGANPVVSNGGLMTAPGVRRRLRALRERGGRLVVIDPSRTATARQADAHHFIRPGSDALLLAALVHTIFDEDRVSLGRIEGFADGLDAVRRAVSDFPPEAVSERTGMPAGAIRGIARDFAEARSAVCYGRMGTSTVRFGTLTSWLIEVLNAITGNLDRPGGAMFPQPAVDVASIQPATQRGRWRSRTRGIPEFMGELPAASLADEIETPGPGQIRALVTLAGNPVLSSPAGHRLSRALEQLDFMVAIDFYLNETTRHADLILPPVDPLERDHFDAAFQLFYVRNVARWSPAVFGRPAEAKTDAEILLELASRLQRGRGFGGRLRALAHRLLLGLGAERALRWVLALALRAGPYGGGLPRPWRHAGLTFAGLRASAHGVDLGALVPALPQRLHNPARRVDLAPREILDDFERLRRSQDEPSPELLLIGRREATSVNSWTHNLPTLMRGGPRCRLHVHPSDAADRKLRDGARVRVTSRVGGIEVPIEITDAVMPGVVSLPHGYGHGLEGTGMQLAAERAGASMNDLTDPAEVDPLSGNAVLSGVPVQIEPRNGPA
jgi:anaerobic selenocysteine-containing dehydrogenase